MPTLHAHLMPLSHLSSLAMSGLRGGDRKTRRAEGSTPQEGPQATWTGLEWLGPDFSQGSGTHHSQSALQPQQVTSCVLGIPHRADSCQERIPRSRDCSACSQPEQETKCPVALGTLLEGLTIQPPPLGMQRTARI